MKLRRASPYTGTPDTPVVPGPDGARTAPFPACDACHIDGTRSLRKMVGELTLCVDAAECCKRYRAGTSASSYAAGLRGELLAVAP